MAKTAILPAAQALQLDLVELKSLKEMMHEAVRAGLQLDLVELKYITAELWFPDLQASIGPCGIEIFAGCSSSGQRGRFNWTLWN